VLLQERGITDREALRMSPATSTLFKSAMPWATRLLASGSVVPARRRRGRRYWASAPHPSALTDPMISRDAAKRHVDKRS